MAPLTASALIEVAHRETQMRRKVYPGRVDAGTMTISQMEFETEGMRMIERVLIIIRDNRTIADQIRELIPRTDALSDILADAGNADPVFCVCAQCGRRHVKGRVAADGA